VPGSPVVAHTPTGALIPLASDTYLGQSLWETGQYELDELLWAGRHAVPGTCVFDVGANVGLVAIELARIVGPAGRVIAIEPMPATAEVLRSNVAESGCRNIEIVNAAAAAVAGEVDLKLAQDAAQHSTAAKMPHGQIAKGIVRVPGVTLDDLWDAAGQPQVSYAKIDVEGAEEAVLRGALRMIAATRPQLIVEIHGRERVANVVALLPRYESVVVPGFISWNYLFRPIR
jgi:FkbM family methyltransferase